MSLNIDNAITLRSSFWISCEMYLFVLFSSHSVRQGSSLVCSFIGCMKLKSVSLSPRTANPCLAKNLRLARIFRRHSRLTLLPRMLSNAVKKAFPQHQDKNEVEQSTPQPLPCDIQMTERNSFVLTERKPSLRKWYESVLLAVIFFRLQRLHAQVAQNDIFFNIIGQPRPLTGFHLRIGFHECSLGKAERGVGMKRFFRQGKNTMCSRRLRHFTLRRTIEIGRHLMPKFKVRR